MTAVAPYDLLLVLRAALRAALSNASHGVPLTSSYLGAATITWLRGTARDTPASWRLLTAMDPVSAAYGSSPHAGVRNLLKVGVEVRLSPRLHAKLYPVDGHSGFLGWVDLTGAGMGGATAANLKLSAALSMAQVVSAHELVQGWWESASVLTQALLDNVEDQARQVPVHSALPPAAGSGSHPGAEPPSQQVTQVVADALLCHNLNVTVWGEAVYTSDDLEQMGWPQNGSVSNPGPYKPHIVDGDLLMLRVKKHGVCNAVLQATSDAFYDPGLVAASSSETDGRRWPWVNKTSVRVKIPVSVGVCIKDLGLSEGVPTEGLLPYAFRQLRDHTATRDCF